VRDLRARFNAWFLASCTDFMDELYGERKRALFGALPASIVELGAGTGANFRYYPAGTRVVAIEPNPAMHEKLRAEAASQDLQLEIRGLRGEALDLADSCADLVVCTLVLCSVDDPSRVVAEARRVLRPGGRFVFLEHVAAPPASPRRALQRIVRRPWRWLFEGCTTDRETWRVLEAAGFSRLQLDHFTVSGPFVHLATQIAGVAVR
jgi:SAM-dependent methyltransferase